jgi:hypothetical protein
MRSSHVAAAVPSFAEVRAGRIFGIFLAVSGSLEPLVHDMK